MALTQITGEGLQSTLAIGSEGGAVTTSVQQGLAKAWVNFNGTSTIAVNDSLNVASLTDDTTGTYRVNTSNAFSSVNHSPVGSNINDSTTANRASITVAASGSASATTSIIPFALYSATASNYLDCTDVNIHIFGDLA